MQTSRSGRKKPKVDHAGGRVELNYDARVGKVGKRGEPSPKVVETACGGDEVMVFPDALKRGAVLMLDEVHRSGDWCPHPRPINVRAHSGARLERSQITPRGLGVVDDDGACGGRCWIRRGPGSRRWAPDRAEGGSGCLHLSPRIPRHTELTRRPPQHGPDMKPDIDRRKAYFRDVGEKSERGDSAWRRAHFVLEDGL